MFHIDVYDFLPELEKGAVNANITVNRYFANRYDYYVQTYTNDNANPHTNEENPYVLAVTGLHHDLPLEMLERFKQEINNMDYSVRSGRTFTIPLVRGDEQINTYSVLKDDELVIEFGYREGPIPMCIVATNLVTWYKHPGVLKKVSHFLGMKKLVSDSPPLSLEVVNELEEILERLDF